MLFSFVAVFSTWRTYMAQRIHMAVAPSISGEEDDNNLTRLEQEPKGLS